MLSEVKEREVGLVCQRGSHCHVKYIFISWFSFISAFPLSCLDLSVELKQCDVCVETPAP